MTRLNTLTFTIGWIVPTCTCVYAYILPFYTTTSSYGPYHRTQRKQSQSPPPLYMNAPGKIQRPENEFSRTYRTETLFGNRRESATLSASSDELENLASRFSLPSLDKLEANVELMRDSIRSEKNMDYISVNGNIVAELSQTCVRTNEDFPVELEFDISVVVKASYEETKDDVDLAQLQYALDNGDNRNRRKKKGGRKKGGGKATQGADLSDIGMKEIESLLKDFEVDEDLDLFEDEAILGSDGVLDVGELVAQMFRLKLDPYPKKPGSQPVSYSITG